MAHTLASVPEVRFAAVGALLLPAAVLCHRLGVGVAPAVALEGVLCVLVAITLPWTYAAGLGLSAWACVTGFVVDDLGVLAFARADLLRLLALVGLSALAALVARHRPPPTLWAAQPSRLASASPSVRPDR